jgi:hypothetical protein
LEDVFAAVGSLIRDPVLYGLMMLLVVTRPETDEASLLSKAHRSYRILLQRRVFATCRKSGVESPEAVLAGVYRSLDSLKKVSATLERFCRLQRHKHFFMN